MAFPFLPKQVKAFDLIVSLFLILLAVLFVPDSFFERCRIDHRSQLLIFLAAVLAGLWSARLYSKKADVRSDPTYLRSGLPLIASLLAIPVCLLFRRIALDLALVGFLFGAGPILGNRLYRLLRPQ